MRRGNEGWDEVADIIGMSRRRRNGPTDRGNNPRAADLVAEAARLSRELDEARAKLKRIEEHGIAAVTAQRLAALEEGQQVARGQAVEAALARSRAEAELRALRKAIEDAPGPMGWLLRKAARRLKVST
jgi:predicted  nucleic acid-binding Zn-ribbon protein